MTKNLTCIVEDCSFNVKQVRRGMCGTHYARFKRLGTTELIPMTRAINGAARVPILDSCEVPDCDADVWAKNFCQTHYNRHIKQGTTDLVGHRSGEQHPGWRGGRSVVANGYIEIYVPPEDACFNSGSKKNRMLEHRYVMAKHLGRPLIPSENVHHINGVKDDNRLENLELWTTSQPRGQRIQDKLAWAREFIARYGAEYND